MNFRISYNVNGRERRELAEAISDLLNTVPTIREFQATYTKLAGAYWTDKVRSLSAVTLIAKPLSF